MNLMRLVIAGRGSTPPTATTRMFAIDALGDADGLIALTGGPAGAIDRLLERRRRRSRRERGWSGWRRCSATGSMSSCSATTRQRRATSPPCSISPIALGLPLVATNEPYFAAASDYRGAGRAAVRRRRRARRHPGSPPPDAASIG